MLKSTYVQNFEGVSVIPQTYRWFWLTISLIVILTSAYFVFPLPGPDSIYFLPAAWFYANNKGLINPLVLLACETDPLHLCRYCFHLPLFPWLVGSIAKIYPTVQTLFIISGLIAFAKVFLFNHLLSPYLERKAYYYPAYIGTILVLTFYSLPSVGRPEILSSLLIIGVYLLYQRYALQSDAIGMLPISAALGLLVACHVTGYYLSLLVLTIAISLSERTLVEKLIQISGITLLSLFIGIGIVWASPNGFDTIRGIVQHTGMQAARHGELTVSKFFYYFFMHPSYFLFGAFFLLAMFFYLADLKNSLLHYPQSSQRLWVRSIVSLSLIGLAIGIYLFFIKNPPRVYDLTQFSSVLFLYILSQLKSSTRLIRRLYLAFIALALVFSARTVVLFFDYLQDGKTYTKAVAEIRKYAVNNRIQSTQALWVLSDDLSNFTHWQGQKVDEPVFIQQATFSIPPFVQQHAELWVDWRTRDVRRLGPLPLTNRAQGYSFSVWKFQSTDTLGKKGETNKKPGR